VTAPAIAAHRWNAHRWKKSSRSASNGQCVEVAAEAELVAMRDSKDIDGTVLAFDAPTWRAFVADIKVGTFDRP
jgi:hypothetical protein